MDELEYLNVMQNLKNNNQGGFITVDDSKETQIALNEYNEIDEYVSQDPYAVDQYLKNYCLMAAYYPEIGYDLLDQEFRDKKYNSIEEYKQYVSDNMSSLLYATVKENRVIEKEGYNLFIVVDANNNYYFFKVTDIMKYSVITDIYTVDIEEITNHYDDSNVQQRVVINIQKIVSALNNKDYEYVYSKLSESFKQNQYPTYEQFKEYISSITNGKSEVSFELFRNEGEIYIYDITLGGNRAGAGSPVKMQIIMKLKDNRNFEMSFNIEETVEE